MANTRRFALPFFLLGFYYHNDITLPSLTEERIVGESCPVREDLDSAKSSTFDDKVKTFAVKTGFQFTVNVQRKNTPHYNSFADE